MKHYTLLPTGMVEYIRERDSRLNEQQAVALVCISHLIPKAQKRAYHIAFPRKTTLYIHYMVTVLALVELGYVTMSPRGACRLTEKGKEIVSK